jgi:S-adenosylmethionine decarboxylase
MSDPVRLASVPLPERLSEDNSPYYVEKDGLRFAGTHLLVDLWGAQNLTDAGAVEAILREAIRAAGATLLRIDLHSFDNSGGVTGIAILAESHMSIHTWPETGYAAIDIFVCGSCDAYKAIPVLERGFEPKSLQLSEHKRGLAL